MNSILAGMRSVFRGFARENAPSRETTPQGYTWTQFGGTSISPRDSFDNVFPYVNAIAQRFSTIIPYAVNADGQRLNPTPPAIAAIYNPNDTYSCLEFLKHIASSILTQSHLDVLVWTHQNGIIMPGGDITPDNIVGYTFLPQSSREYNSSRTDWQHLVTMTVNGVEDTYEFSRLETIALTYSVHPVDPTRGISPAMTIQKWANIDDMIADYERGFFGNGAVPAGMMGIVSESAADFQRDKNRLEDTFRGAGNNNGVVYNMIPVDPITRKPSQTGKLVWVPFQQANDTLDLSNVAGMVNNRMASALAVPDIVRGIDTGQTYANAQMAERAFVENTLQPLCMTIWDKWQFELDRITGGLGYGLNFDLDLPAQADVEQVQAETQQTQVNTLITLINAGASISDAVKALGLPAQYERLTLVSQNSSVSPAIDEPATMARQIETASEFERSLNERERDTYRKALQHCREFFREIIELAQRSTNDRADDLNGIALELVSNLYADYQGLILRYAYQTGKTLAESIEDLAKKDKDIREIWQTLTFEQVQNITRWDELPQVYEAAYLERLKNVALDASRNGFNQIQTLLQQADADGLTFLETQALLSEYVDEQRSTLLARNELVNAERLGSHYSAEAMAGTLHLKVNAIWTSSHDATVCEFCKYMDGKKIALGESFMDKGAEIEINGKTYKNTFLDKTTPDGHPNCRCFETYEVIGVENDD